MFILVLSVVLADAEVCTGERRLQLSKATCGNTGQEPICVTGKANKYIGRQATRIEPFFVSFGRDTIFTQIEFRCPHNETLVLKEDVMGKYTSTNVNVLMGRSGSWLAVTANNETIVHNNHTGHTCVTVFEEGTASEQDWAHDEGRVYVTVKNAHVDYGPQMSVANTTTCKHTFDCAPEINTIEQYIINGR